VYDSRVYERFCCSTIEEGVSGSSLFGHLYHDRHFHCSVSGDIYRHWSTGSGESYSTQALAKSCSPSSLMSLINSFFSSSVIPFTLDAMLVTDWKSLSSVPIVDRLSTTELKALLMRGLFFFSRQFRARCPCWEHSKHLPFLSMLLFLHLCRGLSCSANVHHVGVGRRQPWSCRLGPAPSLSLSLVIPREHSCGGVARSRSVGRFASFPTQSLRKDPIALVPLCCFCPQCEVVRAVEFNAFFSEPLR
jgi:hypothetical protein